MVYCIQMIIYSSISNSYLIISLYAFKQLLDVYSIQA